MTTKKPGFDPKQHLMKVKGGADYLEVKWRLVWFREDWPNGAMETEAVEISKDLAVFRATVTAIDAEGKVCGSATGYKTCTPQQFKFGYVEKAETGALGRALACLGYGTQFEPEFDETEDFIADSPVQRAPQAPQRPQDAPKPENPSQTPPPANIDRERAMKRLHAIGSQFGVDHEGLRALVVAKAAASGESIGSLQEASGWVLAETANAIEKDPEKLRGWVAKQAELMPSPEDVPNPDRHTY